MDGSQEVAAIAEVVKRRGPKVGGKKFRPESKCKTCMFSVAHKKFHQDLLNSTYFDPNAVEGVTMIIKRWKVQKTLGYRNVMTHMQRHLAPVKRFNDEKAAMLVETTPAPLPVNLQIEDEAETAYERALNKTITKFEQALENGTIKLTANTGLQAIKIKADIETKNKDRKLDFIKAFSAMGQKQKDGEARVSD